MGTENTASWNLRHLAQPPPSVVGHVGSRRVSCQRRSGAWPHVAASPHSYVMLLLRSEPASPLGSVLRPLGEGVTQVLHCVPWGSALEARAARFREGPVNVAGRASSSSYTSYNSFLIWRTSQVSWIHCLAMPKASVIYALRNLLLSPPPRALNEPLHLLRS